PAEAVQGVGLPVDDDRRARAVARVSRRDGRERAPDQPRRADRARGQLSRVPPHTAREAGTPMRRFLFGAALLTLGTSACRPRSSLSTEEITGEWRKSDDRLPPISRLISAEGVGLR